MNNWLQASAFGCFCRNLDLAIKESIAGRRNRWNPLFTPGGYVKQSLVDNPKIINLVLWIVEVSGAVIVDTVIVIIEAEPVVCAVSLSLLYCIPVPVSVPGHSAFIQQAAQGDDLSVDIAGWDRTAAAFGDSRSNQHRQLWIEWVPVRIAELVIDAVAGIRNLMTL